MITRPMLLIVLTVSSHAQAGGQERVPPPEAARTAADEVEAVLRGYLDAYAAQDPVAWRDRVVEDFLLIENGYLLEQDRFTSAWDPDRPTGLTYRLHDLDIEVVGEVAVYHFELGWYEQGQRRFWGVESGHAKLVGERWRIARHHMTWLPPREDIDPRVLEELVGEYRGVDAQGNEDQLVLQLEDGSLYMSRPDDTPVTAGVGRIEVIPSFDDVFFAEIVNGMMRFERDDTGDMVGFVFTPSLEFPPGLRHLRYEKIW